MSVDPEELHEFEAELAGAAADAGTRLRVSLAWLRAADGDLSALRRPVWGGPVDAWHRAADAVADSAETCAAYEAFRPVD